jgi:transposase
MSAPKEREQQEARRLRREGWSLRRIAVELGVSLSSASTWVRDIPRPGVPGEAEPLQPSVRRPEPERSRICSACRQSLPLTSFNRHPGGRQWWCRECFREYF